MNKDSKKAYFGVAGFPPAFFESELKKKRENVFRWLSELSLDWIELQCTYGVKMKTPQALLYRELAEKNNIGISIHAPYFITLASGDKDVVQRSLERIIQSFALAKIIGAGRIIFHPGHFPGTTSEDRESGIKQLISLLNSIRHDIPEDIFLYAETAGKKAQIGSAEEILRICSEVSYVRPCFDLAHVHAFNGGTLKSTESICDILDLVEKRLGKSAFDDIHFHMYPVEVDHTGEKRHRAFDERIDNIQTSLFDEQEDNLFYPRPDHFVAAIKKKNITPVVVCEALNSQEAGAKIMKDLYYGKEDK